MRRQRQQQQREPQQVVNDATLQGIHSGNVDLSLVFDAKGDQGGHIDVGVSGPFQSQGKNQLRSST